MPMNGFNVGRDVTLQIFGSDGQIANWATITEFDKKQETVHVKSKNINGEVQHLELPDGWSGTLSLDRSNSNVDDYFAQLESNYYAGLTINPAQITESITEVTGATSQYRYTRVMMKLDDAGKSAGENILQQKISWAASKRLKIQ